jgi:hypothetical protein
VADHLVVILGAGASFDCASHRVLRSEAWKPPLTGELFQRRETFLRLLDANPLASAAASVIRVQVEGSDAFSIEEHLRETLRPSEARHIRRQYTAIPYYLRDLLSNVSTKYTTQPDRYYMLLTQVQHIPDVLFITLNYDSILEYALRSDQEFRQLSDYIRPGQNWSLVKLHGSVDWVRNVMAVGQQPRTLQTVVDAIVDQQESISSNIEFAPYVPGVQDLEVFVNPMHDRFCYPALSVPLGGDDEATNCPGDHRRFAARWLSSKESLNLLTIGYSGLDHAALDLLEEARTPIGTACIVNPNGEEARALVSNLRAVTGSSIHPGMSVREMSFGEFAEAGELEAFIRRVQRA